MEWFRHDYNAHDDIKQKRLLKKSGLSALGLYWYLVELLYQNNGHMSDSDLRLEAELVDGEQFLDPIREFGLLTFENGEWLCKRVTEELSYKDEMKRKKSEAGKRGMASRWGDNTVITENNKTPKTDNTVITENNKTEKTITENNTIPYHTIPKKKDDTKVSSKKETDDALIIEDEIIKFTSNERLRATLREFVEYRKQKKERMTLKAFRMMLNKMDGFTDDERIDALETSMISNWTGVFPKHGGNGNKTSKHKDYSEIKKDDLEKEWDWNV